MNELSLSYYISISKGNAELLKTFKTLLLEDVQSMDTRFFSAVEANDIDSMRNELHKLYPIVFNLNFSEMLDLIEKYRHCSPDEIAKLNQELRTYLAKIYDLIKTG